jgi:predicted flap endonuclease-1-like 5' DNA nuclease
MVQLRHLGSIPAASRRQLHDIGVDTTERLLLLAARKTGRADLAHQAALPEEQILRWARLADVLRVPGIGPAYAVLLNRLGIESIADLRRQKADQLYKELTALNSPRRKIRRLPARHQIEAWIGLARRIQPSVKE